jgi:hypothetical protein
MVVELRIFRMVQFINLGSIISRSMSLPREIRVVALVWGVEIGI